MHHRKITAALVIAALMTLAVVTAGCTSNNSSPSPTPTPVVQTTSKSGANTTLTSTAGFKITFPSKYNFSENGSTQAKVYIYLDPTNNTTGVVVGTEQVAEGATLADLSNYYSNNLLAYQNISYSQRLANTTLSGKPAQTFTYQATTPIQVNQTATEDVTIKVTQTWTINNGTSYLVTYKAPPNDFSKFQSAAQQIINSFRLT